MLPGRLPGRSPTHLQVLQQLLELGHVRLLLCTRSLRRQHRVGQRAQPLQLRRQLRVGLAAQASNAAYEERVTSV